MSTFKTHDHSQNEKGWNQTIAKPSPSTQQRMSVTGPQKIKMSGATSTKTGGADPVVGANRDSGKGGSSSNAGNTKTADFTMKRGK